MLRDPGDRAPAPEPLRRVQAFVNTVDIENGVEELQTPAELAEVLARIGAAGTDALALGPGELRRALELREALRVLLLANNGAPLDAAAVSTLEDAARAARLSLRFEADGSSALQSEADGLDGALGSILAVAYTAMADGSWRRLKACPRDVCGWIFYDRSKNLSSRWCAMSVCGNRTKTKAYRRRVHH